MRVCKTIAFEQGQLRRRRCAWLVLVPLIAASTLLMGGCFDDVQQAEVERVDSPTPTPVSSSTNDSTPTFSWSSVSGSGITYHLEYGQSSDFTAATPQQLAQTTFTPAVPLADGGWFWRVRAVNGSGLQSPWSPTSSFVIDTVAPTLDSTSPVDGATNISTTSVIRIVFNESMDTSVDPVLSFAPLVTGTVSVIWTSTNLDNDTAVFTLSVALDFGTDYTVTISGAQDLAGNGMADDVIAFRSAFDADPTVIATLPANGEKDVQRSVPITITYNQPMDDTVAPAFAFEPPFTGYDPVPVWSTTTEANDTATLALAAGEILANETTYTVAVSGGQNIDGVVGATHIFSFTTVDDVPPVVLSTTPPDGAVDVTVNTAEIQIVFDETMDTGVEPVLDFNPAYTGAISAPAWSPTATTNDTATFTLFDPLNEQTDYTVTVAGGQDDSGNLMAAPADEPRNAFQFTTAVAPALISIAVTPANPTLTVGDTKQFTATGTYDDGSTWNITSTVTWSSSNTTVATIDAAGLASALGAGTTTITATLGILSGNTTATAVVCIFIISPPNETFPSDGGTGSVTVTALLSVCSWVATSNDSWITVTSGAEGTGNGTVSYLVESNAASGIDRNGTIMIADQTFMVNQSGATCIYSLNPTGDTIAAVGGTLNTALSASPEDCSWGTSSNVGWTTASPGSGTGSATITVLISSNTSISPRTGTITAAGQTFTITQNGASCADPFSISSTSASVVVGGGTGSVTVTAPAVECSWTATSNVSWASITAGTSGTGDGTVSYSVSSNPSINPRSGTLTIAGLTFTISQSGVDCSTTTVTATSSTSYGVSGGSGSVSVTPPSTECTWTASESLSWVRNLSPISGTGNGTVNYDVDTNVITNTNTSSRSGPITIAGKSFTISQSGCSYFISPTSQTVGPGGGSSFSVSVSVASGCTWTASESLSWVSSLSPTSGSGGRTVNYNVSSNVVINTERSGRSGTISVAGRSHAVSQLGCTYTLSSNGGNFRGFGGSGGVIIIVSSSDCTWTATRNQTWVTIDSGSSGSGTGTVNYSVGSTFLGSQLRNATLAIADEAFSICENSADLLIDPGAGTITHGVGVCGGLSVFWTITYFSNDTNRVKLNSTDSSLSISIFSISGGTYTAISAGREYDINCGFLSFCDATVKIQNTGTQQKSFSVDITD